jgi:hopene-associated glycosyltransferase HpnB
MGLTIIGAASLAVWVYLLCGRGGWWRQSPARLTAVSRDACVAAVIPARDEAEHIGRAVASLIPQVDAVIVVDDNSSDDTAGAARLGGAYVIKGLPLEAGWTGKLWAMSQGVDASQSEYLLLTDADIVHAPGSVAQLLGRAQECGFDLVSLMVRLRTESFAERAFIPAFVFFFLMLYPPAWIEDPRRRTAGAAGGCMLIRRERLERIGGIAAIRGELIDDCALARSFKRDGGRVWLGIADETYSTRAYGSFGEIWRMISRTAFTQLNYSAVTLAGTIVGLAITYLAPPVLTFTFRPVPAALGAAAWLAMSIAYTPMLRYYGRTLLWAPALPLIALFYTGATIDSAIRYWMGRGGSWKGRAQAGVKTVHE